MTESAFVAVQQSREDLASSVGARGSLARRLPARRIALPMPGALVIRRAAMAACPDAGLPAATAPRWFGRSGDVQQVGGHIQAPSCRPTPSSCGVGGVRHVAPDRFTLHVPRQCLAAPLRGDSTGMSAKARIPVPMTWPRPPFVRVTVITPDRAAVHAESHR